MKKKTSLFLLSLTLVLAMLLAACGQSQTSVPPDESDSAANTSAVDTSTPVNEPEDPQTTDASAETETAMEPDIFTEEPETDAATEDEEPSNAAADTPGTDAPASDESEPTPEPEPVQTAEPAPAPEQDTASTPEPVPQEPALTPEPEPEPEPAPEPKPVETPASNTALSGTTLTLRFGGGEEFTINMYDNDTANKIAEYVGTASWQLPIYHFDDYDGWESFQYYDIPSRYDIPDGSESVTSEKAGTVYYSHPNRIILFYQDSEISTEYTPVGYIDFSQDLVDAVENNPVVQGWGNKLVFIQS